MHLKKLTLKPATIPRAKRGSKPLPRDAEGHIIRRKFNRKNENNNPKKFSNSLTKINIEFI